MENKLLIDLILAYNNTLMTHVYRKKNIKPKYHKKRSL